MRMQFWAAILFVLAVVSLQEVEGSAKCGRFTEGHIETKCNTFSEGARKDKCKNWAAKVLVKENPAWPNKKYMIREYERCANKDFTKYRCCWGKAGVSEQSRSGRRLQDYYEYSPDNFTENSSGNFACMDPVQHENGTWTDLQFYVDGDIATGVQLEPGTYSVPFVPLVQMVDPPSACNFILSYVKYDSEPGTFDNKPKFDVVDLTQPSSGSCSLTPDAEKCTCSSLQEDPNCPNYCLELERFHRCSDCSLQQCAAICTSVATCAGIEYHNNTEACKLMLRPSFSITPDLTVFGQSNEESYPSFSIGLSYDAPPPVEENSADGSTTCYGRSNQTALNSRAVELKSAASKGGKCAVSNHTNRVQQCGPAGFGGVGLCGAAECSTMCTQNPNCTAYDVDIDVDKGRCFLVFNETPSDVDEDTSDTYRCFVIDRSVDARSSDWFNIFLHVGFRDVATEPNGTAINLRNLPNLTSPGPEIETCGTDGCSMNCNTTDCCKTLESYDVYDEKRCCTGTRYSEKGRTCCYFEDHYYYQTTLRCCTRIGDEQMRCDWVTDEGNITSFSDYGNHYSSGDDLIEEEIYP